MRRCRAYDVKASTPSINPELVIFNCLINFQNPYYIFLLENKNYMFFRELFFVFGHAINKLDKRVNCDRKL